MQDQKYQAHMAAIDRAAGCTFMRALQHTAPLLAPPSLQPAAVPVSTHVQVWRAVPCVLSEHARVSVRGDGGFR